MKFKAKILIGGTDHWHWETFTANLNGVKPSLYVRQTLENCNSGLRPGERPREYGGIIRIIDRLREHEWEKTNLVTIEKRGRFYDTYGCKNCTVTAKRFGIGGSFVRDKRYKAEKWERCSG